MTEPRHTPARQRLPRRRAGLTHSVEIGGAPVFLTANTRENARLGEVFVKWGKDGSTSAGLMDTISILLSLALQYGVPLQVIVSKLRGMRFEPMGMTDDPEITEASSVVDWLAHRLALDYLPDLDEEARALTQPREALT